MERQGTFVEVIFLSARTGGAAALHGVASLRVHVCFLVVVVVEGLGVM